MSITRNNGSNQSDTSYASRRTKVIILHGITTSHGVVLQEVTTPPADVVLTPCRDSSGYKSIKKNEVLTINEGSGALSYDLKLTHWRSKVSVGALGIILGKALLNEAI